MSSEGTEISSPITSSRSDPLRSARVGDYAPRHTEFTQERIPETRTPTTPGPSIAGYIATGDALRALSGDEAELGDAQECALERADFSVRPADSSRQRSLASLLIGRRYSSRGYETESAATLPHSPKRIMLEASSRQNLFGTLTLGLESDNGLLADQLYKKEIDAFRNLGCRVCEVSGLAIEPQYGTKQVLGSLFYVAYLYLRIIHKSTDVFVEVHPRHARFYVRMLGFHQIGEIRICPRVDAPAVLLHLEFDYMDAQIAKCHGSRNTQDRSLYPYFLPHGEENSLANRIGKSRHTAGRESVTAAQAA